MPVRNPRKGEAAIAAILRQHPAANVSLRELDLSVARLRRRARRDPASRRVSRSTS